MKQTKETKYRTCILDETTKKADPRPLRGFEKGKKNGSGLCAEGYCSAKVVYDRLSAYANGYGVQVCKGTRAPAYPSPTGDKRTGKGKESDGGLGTWFAEEWVNVCETDANGNHPPCGSDAHRKSSAFPYCRPSRRTSGSGRSKTAAEMTAAEKRSMCAEKRRLEAAADASTKTRVSRKQVVAAATPSSGENRRQQGGQKKKNEVYWPDMSLVREYNTRKKDQKDAETDGGEKVTLYRPQSLEGVKGAGKHKLRVFVPHPNDEKKKNRALEVRFGHNGYEDFTIHRDRERQKNYCKRSAGITCDGKPCTETSPNYWSRMILWDC